MKKYIFMFLVIIIGKLEAAEWVTLAPADLMQLEVIDSGVHSFAEEGVYVKHKSEFPLSNSVTCSKKQFVAFVNPKLADRAMSAMMYAMSSSKTIKFYVDGCSNDYPLAKSFMLMP
ncbi:hypothetical protein [Aliikangiella maris]|uniref:Uncharacterized protein n=2 Tax=Aliikangiella maris TaxID=3162458 RepID=A0ABV3MV03_9GAMM